LLCTVSSTTVFSIHVLTSFLDGYSATLAAKLFIKLELSLRGINGLLCNNGKLQKVWIWGACCCGTYTRSAAIFL